VKARRPQLEPGNLIRNLPISIVKLRQPTFKSEHGIDKTEHFIEQIEAFPV
jgi:hypothetical protein